MELNQYVFLTHIIFTVITSFYLISLFLSKSKINDNINRLGAWIMFLLFSSYLYIYDDYSSLFTNKSSLFYWSGLLCFCYAYAIGAAQFKFSNINYIFAMILFCIGSLSYLYQSMIIEKNYTLDNHVYSFWDNIFYLISSVLYLIYGYIDNFYILLAGVIFFLIGRLLSLYISYRNHKKVQLGKDLKSDE